MLPDVIFKTIIFIENKQSHFFYDSAHDSVYGNIYGVKGLTLPKAITILKDKGIDPINNFKMSISTYYH